MGIKEKSDKKKKHIIESLKSCLERNVYSQVSLEDVAAEAGLSKGGLRHYFPTREQLYLALIEDFFTQISEDNIELLRGMGSRDKALISTLFGIENFLLNKRNIRIFINLVLNGLEDETIMEPIRTFIRGHLLLYQDIIKNINKESTISTEEIELRGRVTQIILLCAGLVESIDPINLEGHKLIQLILTMMKRK